MLRFIKRLDAIAEHVNWGAALMLVGLMLLTTADVVLRFFGHPIPGTYEIVGLVSSLVVSFSLGYTSVARGHIAVDLLTRRLSLPLQQIGALINAAGAALLFALITWQAVRYGMMLIKNGEVSPTIKLPIYPFAFGVAAGCGLLCIVLLGDVVRAVRIYRDFVK
ncbi:MAG: TRAP transporter small permease [Desulfobacterota bacterium]|nr:TRAP transporter small permease [Thermodesulfobacteriota bacterium]